jgi:hypothetical protein
MTARQKTAAKNGVLPPLFTAAFVAWRRSGCRRPVSSESGTRSGSGT